MGSGLGVAKEKSRVQAVNKQESIERRHVPSVHSLWHAVDTGFIYLGPLKVL